MTQLKLNISGAGKAKSLYANFKLVRTAWETRFDALTAQDKANALNIINNWGTATQIQKIEALGASMAFLYIIVGYLIYKEFKA